MKALTIDVQASAGRILSCTIFRPGGRKLLAKGHVVNADDIRLLETEGLEQVWVTELEEGEIGEDEAVCQVAREMSCGCMEIRLAAGGRANLFTTEDCCVLVDDELLKQINCIASLVIATGTNFSFARAGTRIATVKSAPFAIAQSQLDAIINILLRPRVGRSFRRGRSASPPSPFFTAIRCMATGRGNCSSRLCASAWNISASPPASRCRPSKRNPPWRVICNTCCAPSLP